MNSKLLSLRLNKNWTQDYVAEQLGLSQPAYSKLEQGQVKLTVDRAGKLAELYEIEPEYFFTNDAPIVNFNDNSQNKNLMQHVDNFHDNSEMKEMYEQRIAEQARQIETLNKRIETLESQLNTFVEKLAAKL